MENSQRLAIVFLYRVGLNPAPVEDSDANVKLAEGWQFLRDNFRGVTCSFRDLRNGMASAKEMADEVARNGAL